MPDPAGAYVPVIASVLASAPPGAGTVEAAFAQVVMGSSSARAAPLVPFDPANPSAEARAALKRMEADAKGTAVPARREAYIDRFGFDRSEPHPILNQSIREPWTQVIVTDLDAALAVSKVVGVPPAHVLALWIAEGKIEHNDILRGKTLTTFIPVDFFEEETDRQFLAFARSLLLFRVFGADPLIAFESHTASDGDNKIQDPRGPHDAKFKKGLADMRAADVRGLSRSDQEILDFFTKDALIARHIKTGAANDAVEVTLAKGSLASWLWLQTALFEATRVKLEKGLGALYPEGGAVGLSLRPWVTYLFWNTNREANVIADNFGGAVHVEAAISRRFGSEGTDPDHLSPGQLDRYYARGEQAGNRQSTAAWANAVTVKFLVETIEPWFHQE
jgi:hypothetical protein